MGHIGAVLRTRCISPGRARTPLIVLFQVCRLFREFFLDWEKFELRVVDQKKKSKHNFTSNTFFLSTKFWRLRDNCTQHFTVRQVTDYKKKRDEKKISNLRQGDEDKNTYRNNVLCLFCRDSFFEILIFCWPCISV